MIVTAEGALKGEELKSVLEQRLPYLDVRVSVLGYIQRGGSPTRFDRLIATLFGAEAVNLLSSGKSGYVVGIKDNHLTYILLEDAATKRKEIDYGIYKIIEEVSV